MFALIINLVKIENVSGLTRLRVVVKNPMKFLVEKNAHGCTYLETYSKF